MKRFVLFVLAALTLAACKEITSSEPTEFDAHQQSARPGRSGTPCAAAAIEAGNAAAAYRRTTWRARRVGEEGLAETVAAFGALAAAHNDLVAKCSQAGQTYTVGGTATGLTAQSVLILQNNGTNDLQVTADGPFTFTTPLNDGDSYDVSIMVRPIDQSCIVVDGSGVIAGASVNTVRIECTDVTADVLTPTNPGDLVISEIMQDPTAVTDAAGEWFEIYNPTGSALELNGLVVRDDGSNEFTVGESLVIQPGGLLVFGVNADAATNGGAPVNYAYSGFTLANSSDEIELVFGGTVIDRVAYGPGFPLVAGQAMSLDAGSLDAVSNDDGASWCGAVLPMSGGDLGSPGQMNGGCS